MTVRTTLLSAALVAAIAVGLMPSTSSSVVAVSDAEAATLYGGCVDEDPSSARVTCGEDGEGNCAATQGCSKFLANGSGKEASVNCGASSCGTVPLTSGTCDG
jgi:hypothetical protein